MIEKECAPANSLAGDAFEFPPGSGKYWQPNALFQGRVLGEFPSQADKQVIPKAWLATLPVLQIEQDLAIGVDVARHGSDRSTIAGRSGPVLLGVDEENQLDVDALAGRVIIRVEEWAPICQVNPKTVPIRVDVTGGLGVAPVVFLRNAGYNAIEVNSSSRAIERERYPNKRSELWFTVRDRVRTKDFDLSRLAPDVRRRVERELATPTWEPDSAGRKVVEDKKAMKKRLGESPDIADAVNLAYDGTGGNWRDAVIPDEEMSEYELESDRGSRNW
jgi:hypothetical protein